MKKIILLFCFLIIASFTYSKEKIIAKSGLMVINEIKDEWKNLHYICTKNIETIAGNWWFVVKLYYFPEDKSCFIMVRYQSGDWIFIDDGESFMLKINDDIKKLNLIPGSKERDTITIGYGVNTVEKADYDITKELIEKMSIADSIVFRLYGDKGYITGKFTKRNIKYFKFFYKEIFEN